MNQSDLGTRIRQFDLYDPELQDTLLFDFFNQIRESEPVARTEAGGGVWIVSRYEDALFILQHPETFSSRAPLFPYEHHEVEIPFTMDPPDHGRYRHVLAPMFAPSRARELEPVIRKTARELAQAAREAGRCDFIEAYARPIPSRAFLDSFDIPPDRLPSMIEIGEAAFTMPDGAEGMRRLKQAQHDLDEYFTKLVAERRQAGAVGDDIVSWLIRSEIEGKPLSDDEIKSMLTLLMAASLDTTTSALSNIMAYLASHPDDRDRLVADPSLIPGAIEEFLRFEPMVFNGRTVTQPVEIHGVALQPGDRVMILFTAANHDPRIFSDPEIIDFERTANRHLAFGAGPHRCLGLHLARQTLRIELEEWHNAVPRYSIEPGTRIERRLTVLSAVTSLHLRTQ